MKRNSIARIRREYNAPDSSSPPRGPFALSRLWFQKMLRVVSVVKREYQTRGLSERVASTQPYPLFKQWMEDAVKAKVLDPNAMTLGTLGAGNLPSLRTVLLKGFDEEGFVFYTNYGSLKGKEISRHPAACLLFYWPLQARQVRVDGRVSRVPQAESDEYFASRPRGSQISAWASPQSKPVPGRDYLEKRMKFFTDKFRGKPVPRPPHWGGFRLTPNRMEFWSGRPNRLHDRLLYRLKPGGTWARIRLAP